MHTPTAVVFAFDGGLARNSALRAHALVDAAAAEQAVLDPVLVERMLPGRTLLEASLALFAHEAAHDPTLPELIALRAQRGYRALVQHGVPFEPAVMAELQTAASRGARVVVRADSERRDVEPLLALAGLEHSIALLRCSDDAPRGPGESLLRSWHAVNARLTGMQIAVTQRTAYETSPDAIAVAQEWVGSNHLIA